ncbi:autophagy associated ubiquitin-like modifier Atg12 [Schizosaccharomyces cryophilus OY26]|uniref:Ubiquitin-like protein ATG12 n=1 Tax=Schizosaccharomyces cryophilus (strain OY26 / ATCC MYA-4695 / CBS 11777 / NBRC 106824 / NRRL Y48691) TaxID=653667 RepID=S9W128_SCHCR|nr:autophagy associated ubiquitin-like modifier Atg12 [Schizosaccharomyces cryophilus OY26]EPY51775.1 autophagy associated ubiquitin-like modifier Atg12 [Schizosaccharomyces cryophilus OY26]
MSSSSKDVEDQLNKRLESPHTREIGNLQEKINEIISDYNEKGNRKVNLRFKAIGRTPLLRKNVFAINASHRFDKVIRFLKKELGLQPDSSLLLYVNYCFAPAPDEVIGNLYDNFSIDGYLLIYYCVNVAFG